MAALAGVVVLDLSLQLPGPYATMLLRALGARVVKIEPPLGDPAREIDPPMFQQVNSGKEMLVLDLRTEAGRGLLRRLVERADAFIEGFRPGVMARLESSYAVLRSVNPRLVYCSLSGYGQSGPSARAPGHDLNFLASAGGIDTRKAMIDASIGIPMVDLAAGTTAALLIVAALMEAGRSGQGRYLDSAMFDSAVVWSRVKLPVGGYSASRTEPTYGVFPTSDGRSVAVAVLEDPLWRRLCAALGWGDWLEDPSLATYRERCRKADGIRQRLAATLRSRSASEVLHQAREHDVPITPVLHPEEVQDDPQIMTRALLTDGHLQAPFPSDFRADFTADAAGAGADRESILASFGVTPGEIEQALAAGAFGDARGGAPAA